jgi:cysteine-rich repeat protein/parallel beta-helix repeat protein
LFLVLVQSAVGIGYSNAESIAWPWITGQCETEAGWVLNDRVVSNDPASQICVLPPSIMMEGLRVYQSVYIGDAYFGDTSDPEDFDDPQKGHCATATNSPTTIRSLTQCTVEPSHFDGTIDFQPKSPFCTSCNECTNKLADTTIPVVYLANDILDHASTDGVCIWVPAAFSNRTFDCQGFRIDGDGVHQSVYDSAIYVLPSVTGGSWTPVTGSTIKNCVISDFNTGAVVSFSPDNTFSGNTFRNNTTGLYVTNESHRTIVQANTFEGNAWHGLHILMHSASCVIAGNLAQQNGYYGYYLEDAGYVSVSHNQAVGNGGGFYFNYPTGDFSNNEAVSNVQAGLYMNMPIYDFPVATNTLCWNGSRDVDVHGTVKTGTTNRCDSAYLFYDAGMTTWGCTYPCEAAPVCGNGAIEPPEQCDDGNLVNGDGCRSDCTIEICGDGMLDAGEECDDGNVLDGDGCRANCTVERCGDGIVDLGEGCDDGNTTAGDGCDALCQIEPVNTPVGSDVVVSDAASGVEITFSTVTTAGLTTVAVEASGFPTPEGLRLASDPPQYFDISTTAGFSGDVQVCLPYDEADVLGDEWNLRLMHWGGTLWKDVTVLPVDSEENRICGLTAGFSPFVVMEPLMSLVAADVEVAPGVINLASKGKWVTAYVELPVYLDVAEINAETVTLQGVRADLTAMLIGDHDNDGLADRMFKFSRTELHAVLEPAREVTLRLEGGLFDGTSFVGTYTIRVLMAK